MSRCANLSICSANEIPSCGATDTITPTTSPTPSMNRRVTGVATTSTRTCKYEHELRDLIDRGRMSVVTAHAT